MRVSCIWNFKERGRVRMHTERSYNRTYRGYWGQGRGRVGGTEGPAGRSGGVDRESCCSWRRGEKAVGAGLKGG
jgi:hypothetical protein